MWEYSRHLADCNTAVAVQILSICASCMGRDKLSINLMNEGIKMGRSMNLFGAPPSSEGLQQFQQLSDEELQAISQTAWGIFNIVK